MSETSTTPAPNVHQRIIAIMAEVDGVVKDRRNKEQGFDYSSHDAVVEAVRGSMINHGVVFNLGMEEVTNERFEVAGRNGTRTVYETTAWFRWRMTNADNQSDTIEDKIWMHALSSDDKGPGKLISYAKKYALLACVGFLLPTGIDLDEESIPAPATVSKPAVKAGKTEPAEVVKPGIEEAKVAYKDMRAKTGLSNEFMVAAFGKDIKKASADDITAFVKELEKRWCYKNDLCEAIDKYSPNKDTMDECLALHGVSDVVDWHLIDSARLHALVESLHHRFDLPFPTDKE